MFHNFAIFTTTLLFITTLYLNLIHTDIMLGKTKF